MVVVVVVVVVVLVVVVVAVVATAERRQSNDVNPNLASLWRPLLRRQPGRLEALRRFDAQLLECLSRLDQAFKVLQLKGSFDSASLRAFEPTAFHGQGPERALCWQ